MHQPAIAILRAGLHWRLVSLLVSPVAFDLVQMFVLRAEMLSPWRARKRMQFPVPNIRQ